MSLRFYLKSTSLDAHHSYAGKLSSPFANVADNPAIVANANPGVFGGQVINMVPASVTKGLIFVGRENLGIVANTGGFSIRIRLVPTATASPFKGFGFIASGTIAGSHGFAYRVGMSTAGKFYIQTADLAGNVVTVVGTTVYNAVADVPFDAMMTWDGTSVANAVKCSIDGVEFDTLTVAAPTACTNRKVLSLASMVTGTIPGGSVAADLRANINDLAIWDTQEPHVYTVRTDFDNIPFFDGQLNVSAGAGNIRTGVNETIAGVVIPGSAVIPSLANTKIGVAGDGGTGTYDGSDRWSDPDVANVRLDTTYKANSETDNRTGTAVIPSLANTKIGVAGDGGTGTYDGSDRWTDPTEAKVQVGTEYKANSTTNNKTGTLETVTNVVDEASLTGPDYEATLEE